VFTLDTGRIGEKQGQASKIASQKKAKMKNKKSRQNVILTAFSFYKKLSPQLLIISAI
jgi:hypothetical protein